jgi:hypothetical protein
MFMQPTYINDEMEVLVNPHNYQIKVHVNISMHLPHISKAWFWNDEYGFFPHPYKNTKKKKKQQQSHKSDQRRKKQVEERKAITHKNDLRN